MLPADQMSRPEIDIMEVLGDDPGTLLMHFHYLDSRGERQSEGARHGASDLSADWHTYGLHWSEERIAWYLDGREVWRIDHHVPAEPMYLVANLAVGGSYPGNPDDTTPFPAVYLIDYVRVWQRST
jgi:beta-glucanase (GH16 family)